MFSNKRLIFTSLFLVHWSIIICSGQTTSSANNSININFGINSSKNLTDHSKLRTVDSIVNLKEEQVNNSSNLAINHPKVERTFNNDSKSTLNQVKSINSKIKNLTTNISLDQTTLLVSPLINNQILLSNSSKSSSKQTSKQSSEQSSKINFEQISKRNFENSFKFDTIKSKFVLNSEPTLDQNKTSILKITSNRTVNQSKSMLKKELNKYNELVKEHLNSLNELQSLIDRKSTKKESDKIEQANTSLLIKDKLFKNESVKGESLNVLKSVNDQFDTFKNKSFEITKVNNSTTQNLETNNLTKNGSVELIKISSIESSKKDSTINHTIKHSSKPIVLVNQVFELQMTTTNLSELNELLNSTTLKSKDDLILDQTTIQSLDLSNAEPLISEPHSDQHWIIPNKLSRFF